MKNQQGKIKTYISEANQNRISDTASVESNEQASPQARNTPEPAQSQASELTKEEKVKFINEASSEPEALSAEMENLPPTAASADAEAVAGLPLGGIHGHEGEIQTEN